MTPAPLGSIHQRMYRRIYSSLWRLIRIHRIHVHMDSISTPLQKEMGSRCCKRRCSLACMHTPGTHLSAMFVSAHSIQKKPSAPPGTLHPLPRLDAPGPLCIIMQNPQRRHGLREHHTKARRACYGRVTEGVQAGTEKPERRMKKAKSTGLNFRDQSLRYEMMQVTHLN